MKQGLRILPFLLAAVFLFTALPIAVFAKTVTATISGINTARGEGQLIIYTPDYGATTTTNDWGIEATVGADNKVLSVGGNNSAIPAGGFVVSGHDSDVAEGKMKTWVTENIAVGDYVYYNEHSMLLTVSSEPIDMSGEVFYEISRTYDVYNGTRGESQLVIYDSARGATTGTNEYGYEVTVEDGLVTKLGGNNTSIPKNGFVVSGHGTSLDWLQDNVRMGMRAELDKQSKTVKFIYDAEGLEKGLTALLDSIPAALEEAKENFLYIQYDAIEAQLAKAKQALADAVAAKSNGGTDGEFAIACESVSDMAQKLQYSIFESYTVQYRAVWVRPTQNNAAEVDAYVKQLHDAGINTVCVEGNFNNGVIMTTPEDCLFQRIKTFRYDVLQAYIDACHKYGMECHLWMAIMEVGHSKGDYYYDCIAKKKPQWLSLSQLGTPDNPDDFMMIDPANEEARAYLVDFYEWILRNYDIDCFELDYIRYYTANGTLDFGYTTAAFKGFEEAYGHGVTPTYDPSASYWNDWVAYRQSCVTEMVRAVREMIDRVKPDVLLSADVVATPETGAAYSYQNYMPWLEEGLLDMLHPMAYGDGYGDDIIRQVKAGGDRCMIVTGLGVFMDSLGATEMVRQSAEDNTYGAYGDCFFEASTYLRDKAGDALLETVYRNDAITPFLDPDAGIKSCLTYMQGRIDDILLPLEGLTAEEGQALTAAIANAIEGTAQSRIAPTELQALRNAIGAVANEKAKAVLEDDLLRAERIMVTLYKVSRDDLLNELELPEGEPAPEEPSVPEESATESGAPSSEATSEEITEPTSDPQKSGMGMTVLIVCTIIAVAMVAVIVVLFVRKK